MPRIIDCALAIRKDSLSELHGLIRKAKDEEVSSEMYRTCYIKQKELCAFDEEDKIFFYRKRLNNKNTYIVRDTKKTLLATPRNLEEWNDIIRRTQRQGYFGLSYDFMVSKTLVDNGWFVNLRKLKLWVDDEQKAPKIEEYDDHITLYFQADYEFPDSFVSEMNKTKAKWEGLSTVYGRSYFYGNASLGLHAVREKTQMIDEFGERVTELKIKDMAERSE